jgi:hypothetical protein
VPHTFASFANVWTRAARRLRLNVEVMGKPNTFASFANVCASAARWLRLNVEVMRTRPIGTFLLRGGALRFKLTTKPKQMTYMQGE